VVVQANRDHKCVTRYYVALYLEIRVSSFEKTHDFKVPLDCLNLHKMFLGNTCYVCYVQEKKETSSSTKACMIDVFNADINVYLLVCEWLLNVTRNMLPPN